MFDETRLTDLIENINIFLQFTLMLSNRAFGKHRLEYMLYKLSFSDLDLNLSFCSVFFFKGDLTWLCSFPYNFSITL